MFKTLEDSLQTKKAVIVEQREYVYLGITRQWIKARRANGKKVYTVFQYENGLFSSAI